LTTSICDVAHRNAAWFWPVVAVVFMLGALLALRWPAAQLGSHRAGALPLERDTRAGGATTL